MAQPASQHQAVQNCISFLRVQVEKGKEIKLSTNDQPKEESPVLLCSNSRWCCQEWLLSPHGFLGCFYIEFNYLNVEA